MSKRIYYGWFVVAACFLCMVVSAGIAWFTFPVFIKPLENEFGWTRTQLMIGIGLWAAMTGISSPLIGMCIDRWRPRYIMIAGVAGMGLAALVLSEMRSLSHLYAMLLVTGVSTTACTYLPVASIVSNWFIRRRGLAMSIAMMGMGVGGFVMPNLSNVLIDLLDWRWTYRIFAILLLGLLLPVIALVMRGSPAEIGLHLDGDDAPVDLPEAPAAGTAETDGFSVGQALRMVNFWGIGIADLAAIIGVLGIEAQMVAFSIEAGVDKATATLAYSLIRGVMVLAMVVMGVAADKFNRRAMISLCYGLPGLAVLPLFGLQSAAPLFVFAVFCGICSAGRNALWPLVVNDSFGKRAYASVMGFLFVFWTVGIVIGPPFAGFLFDVTGSYHWVFITSIVAFVIAGLSMAIGAKPRRHGA